MMEDWALLKESIKDTASITDSAKHCLELMGNLMSQSIHSSISCLFIGFMLTFSISFSSKSKVIKVNAVVVFLSAKN